MPTCELGMFLLLEDANDTRDDYLEFFLLLFWFVWLALQFLGLPVKTC